MVKLNKIYTRTGDDGLTGLGTGARTPKDAARIEAIGAVDETNAQIGVARLHAHPGGRLDQMFERIQNDLFDLGADLCMPEDPNAKPGPALRITADQTARLEHEIDALNAPLEPLTSFILPGGSGLAAHLHLARTICRRAERRVVTLAGLKDEPVGPEVTRYLNRLSDFLFVAARSANADEAKTGTGTGSHDRLWVPGENR